MRWITLVKTSPSGKTLFACRYCGSVTPAPSVGSCGGKPIIESGKYAGLTCEQIEEKEREFFLHPLLTGALARPSSMLEKLKELKTKQGRESYIRRDRRIVLQIARHMALQAALTTRTAQDFEQLRNALDHAEEEVLKK